MNLHLNLFNDTDVPDVDGHEYTNLAAAKAAAVQGARALIAEHVVQGRAINLSHRIEIVSDAGTVLAVIPFRELISIVDG